MKLPSRPLVEPLGPQLERSTGWFRVNGKHLLGDLRNHALSASIALFLIVAAVTLGETSFRGNGTSISGFVVLQVSLTR